MKKKNRHLTLTSEYLADLIRKAFPEVDWGVSKEDYGSVMIHSPKWNISVIGIGIPSRTYLDPVTFVDQRGRKITLFSYWGGEHINWCGDTPEEVRKFVMDTLDKDRKDILENLGLVEKTIETLGG